MPYYPKSQIITNLKTNGKELVLVSNEEEYKGDYHKLSTGKMYTGKTPEDGPNLELIPPPPTSPISNYNSPSDPFESEGISPLVAEQDKNFYRATLNKSYFNNDSNFTQRIPPSSYYPVLTQEQINKGQFMRYFTKKTNEIKYIEIDKKTHDDLKNKNQNIAFDLYIPASLIWRIKGDKEEIFNSNRGTAIFKEQQLRWPGFSQFFKDKFTQFYQSAPTQENLYTSGGEFKTPDGKEYIGPYHVHPEKGPMVGAVHIKRNHDLLTRISPSAPQIEPTPQPQPRPQPIPQTPTPPPSMGGGGYSGGGGGY